MLPNQSDLLLFFSCFGQNALPCSPRAFFRRPGQNVASPGLFFPVPGVGKPSREQISSPRAKSGRPGAMSVLPV